MGRGLGFQKGKDRLKGCSRWVMGGSCLDLTYSTPSE